MFNHFSCARRGGEPVRLQLYQWQEALNGEWIDREELPDEFNDETMFITYQTGKGSDHLVPVILPPESIKTMRFLTDKEVHKNVGTPDSNPYIFASTQNSPRHASGWHCINDILRRLYKKGAINATKNRHRVATILAKLKLSEQEKTLIYNHFGHSEKINQNVYQAAPGSLQLKRTGQQLLQIQCSSSENHGVSNKDGLSSKDGVSIKNLVSSKNGVLKKDGVSMEKELCRKETLKAREKRLIPLPGKESSFSFLNKTLNSFITSIVLL